jgi:hypothetical protein
MDQVHHHVIQPELELAVTATRSCVRNDALENMLLLPPLGGFTITHILYFKCRLTNQRQL